MRDQILAIAAAVSLGIVGAPVTAAADDLTTEEVTQINELLAEMQCEVEVENIEKDDDGFELDDVFCADGQYDIELDASYQLVEKRAE
jgi:hypothetical protein